MKQTSKQIDKYRRRTGTFYTPQIWVDYAHKMLADQFGSDWKEKYVVWDCCCGAANLTRGYKFKELYLSTLEQDDIDTIKSCGYNPEATVFQYDFLSEVGFDSVPENLKHALNDGRVLVFINPPYAKANNMSRNLNADRKQGCALTIVNNQMKQHKMGGCAANLHIQFLWKLWQNDKIKIGVFAPPLFMTGSSFDNFRDKILSNIEYKDGILFDAANFVGVSGQWGVSFTIWDQNTKSHSQCYELKLANIDTKTSQIKIIGRKKIRIPQKNERTSFWIHKEIKGKNASDAPTMTSAINIVQNERFKRKLIDQSLGYYYYTSNNVCQNTQNVGIFSSCALSISGVSIIPENIYKIVALFTARKTIIRKLVNWVNNSDEYFIPNENHPEYKQWNNDCFIYALFQSASNQSSLRQINYKEKQWNILNHFFFMSRDEMMDLAKNENWNEMYQMAETETDRYVYNLLKSINLSSDAKDILETARNLVRQSFGCRKIYHNKHSEYHLHAWDAGWAQMKPMLKQCCSKEYQSFVSKFKIFEDKMRDGVYKFGFLTKEEYFTK